MLLIRRFNVRVRGFQTDGAAKCNVDEVAGEKITLMACIAIEITNDGYIRIELPYTKRSDLFELFELSPDMR